MFKIALLALIFSCSLSALALELKTAAQDNSKAKFDPGNSSKPGICIEVLNAIEKELPDVTFRGKGDLTPLLRVEEAIENGSIDVFCGLIKNAKRTPIMNFAEPAVFQVEHKLAVAADDNVVINNFDDIRKLGDAGIIAVPLGTAYVTYLEKTGGLKLDSGAKDTKANLQKLVAKRVRFVYNSNINFTDIRGDADLQGKYKILPVVMAKEDQNIAFSKKLAPEVQQKITAAIDKLKKSGALDEIVKKYQP